MKTLTKKIMIAAVSTLAIAGSVQAQSTTGKSASDYEQNLKGFTPARDIQGTETTPGVDMSVTTGSIDGMTMSNGAVLRKLSDYYDGKQTGANEHIPGSTPDELAAARAEVSSDPALVQELAERGLKPSAIVGSETAVNGDRVYIVE